MSPEQLAEIAAATKTHVDAARSWVLVSITKEGAPQIATCVAEDGDPIDQMALAGMLEGLAHSTRIRTAGAFDGMIQTAD